jgi:hypothetical protein
MPKQRRQRTVTWRTITTPTGDVYSVEDGPLPLHPSLTGGEGPMFEGMTHLHIECDACGADGDYYTCSPNLARAKIERMTCQNCGWVALTVSEEPPTTPPDDPPDTSLDAWLTGVDALLDEMRQKD